MTYLDATLYLSAAVLFVLPLFGCAFVDCTPHEGSLSISAIIDAKVLSTTYAFWGAVFLTSLTHFQIQCKKGLKVTLAIIGSKCLAVPLYLPFGSVSSDLYHYSFAIVGFTLEYGFIAAVLYDVTSSRKRPAGTGIIWVGTFTATAALLLMIYGFTPGVNTEYKRVVIIISEYLFGSSLLVVTKACNYYRLY